MSHNIYNSHGNIHGNHGITSLSSHSVHVFVGVYDLMVQCPYTGHITCYAWTSVHNNNNNNIYISDFATLKLNNKHIYIPVYTMQCNLLGRQRRRTNIQPLLIQGGRDRKSPVINIGLELGSPSWKAGVLTTRLPALGYMSSRFSVRIQVISTRL